MFSADIFFLVFSPFSRSALGNPVSCLSTQGLEKRHFFCLWFRASTLIFLFSLSFILDSGRNSVANLTAHLSHWPHLNFAWISMLCTFLDGDTFFRSSNIRKRFEK